MQAKPPFRLAQVHVAQLDAVATGKESIMELGATLAAIVSGALGFGLRALWDSYIRRRDTIRIEVWKIRAAQLEQRLSQFYWPVYLRLQRDNVVWKKILEREHPSDEERRKLAFEIERTVILPNHIETVRIIQSAIHLGNIDKELEPLLMAYLRHVDVYTSIRSAGIHDKDPIAFDEPWPKGLFDAIRRRLMAYQAEYEALLRDRGIPDLREVHPVSSPAPDAGLKNTS